MNDHQNEILHAEGVIWNPDDSLGSALSRLRRLPGWQSKGEPHLSRLQTWLSAKRLSSDQLEALVRNFCHTRPATLKFYENYPDAIEQRYALMARTGELPLAEPIESPQGDMHRKTYGYFGPCETCGEGAGTSGWAGLYCAEHSRWTHLGDVWAGQLIYPEGPRAELCDHCEERWYLLCRLGKFCLEHSEGVVAECLKSKRFANQAPS